MHEPQFDSYAADYQQLHAHSIRFSGDTADYFAAYKVEIVAAEMPEPAGGFRILDFGGGTGNALSHFCRLFPASRILLADPSLKSLEAARARHPGAAEFIHLLGEDVPLGVASCDVVFVACVFHHVPAARHVSILHELRRVLRPGGSLFVFEHNPLNPLTCKAVRDCPFDADAKLIRGSDMCARIHDAGFASARLRYRIFFPRLLRKLRPLEPYLAWLPLGGQYYVHART
jgi:ubiquinone/menaquinone biosynthesis C-methylase UbiE